MRGGWRLGSETKTRTFLKQEEKHSMVCHCSYLFQRVALTSSHHGHATVVSSKIWINSQTPSQQGGDEGLRRLGRSCSALVVFRQCHSPASRPAPARETWGIQWFLKIYSYPGIYVELLEFKQSCMGSSFSFHDLWELRGMQNCCQSFNSTSGFQPGALTPTTQMEQRCRDSECN